MMLPVVLPDRAPSPVRATMSDPRRGVVLVAVLWLIALLSALAMAASVTFRGFAAVVAVDRDRVRAEALLTAGLETAAHAIEILGDTPLDQLDITVMLASGSVRAHISDEGGRIDIGKAPVEVLAGLFRSLGAPETESNNIARSIAEWRKPVETGAPSGTGGSNDPAKVAYEGQPFSDVRQLLQIPGMPPEWVTAIAPLTTVYGRQTVNPLTAPAEVIAALPGVDASRVRAFLQMRRNLPADTSQLAAMLGTAQRYLEVKTHPVALVDLMAILANGFTEAAQAVIVLMPQDSEPYRVLVWNRLASRSRE
jgi:general secretion pathway protein K